MSSDMGRLRHPGRPPHTDVLTPAEWRVAEFVRHGLNNRAIGELQGVSLDAVKYHVSSALAKRGFTRRAELRRWTGVRADSNLMRRSEAMDERSTALGPIGQIARGVTDVLAAERWFRDVMGLRHLYTFGKLAFFDCDGTRLFLSEGGDGATILYFQVPAIHAAHDALLARGVEFVAAPHLVHRHNDGTEEGMAFFIGNEGGPLALMSQVRSAQSLVEGEEVR